MEEVIVLHRHGARSHYRALEFSCKEKNVEFNHYKYPRFKRLFTCFFKFSFSKIREQYALLFKVFPLFFESNKKIIVGDNPYSYHILYMLILGLKHDMYYHSSWPHWEGDKVPTKPKLATRLRKYWWKLFLEKHCKSIFVVTKAVADNLKNNYQLSCPVKVVGHSHTFSATDIEGMNREEPLEGQPLKVLIVGRMIRSKGIYEVLDCAKMCPDIQFTFVGSGKEEARVKEMSDEIPNAHFVGYIGDQNILKNYYLSHDVLAVPSKKDLRKHWEELFGMVHVEAMACGCIPIATDHIGPREIIQTGVNGFLIEEGDIQKQLVATLELLGSDIELRKEVSKNAKVEGLKYTTESVSEHWEPLFY